MNPMMGLPRPPMLPGPTPGPQGGIRGQMPGMPYQPDGTASALQGIGEIMAGIGKMKEQQKQQANKELQEGLSLRSQGLPVDPQKLAKLAKKAGYDKFLDFNNPMMPEPPNAGQSMPQQQMPNPQGAQMPLQGPPGMGPQQLGGPQGMPPPPGMPQGGPGMPNLPTHSQPGATFMPPSPQQMSTMQRPGMMQRAGNFLGFGQPQVDPNSQGARAIEGFVQGIDQQRGLQQSMAGAQFREKIMELNLSMQSMGYDLQGRPVSPQDQEKARFLQVQRGRGKAFDSDDLKMLMQTAERTGVPPENRQEYANAWVAQKVGMDKQMELVNTTAKNLMSDGGVDPAKAYSEAFNIVSGKGATELPNFNAKTLGTYFKHAMDLREQYPTAPPEAWRAVDPYIMTGDVQTAMKILGRAPTKGALAQGKSMRDERRADIGLGLEKDRNNIARGNLDVARGNLGVAQGQLALSGQRFAQEVNQNNFGNQMRILGANLEMVRTSGKEITDQQLTGFYNLLSNVMPGMFNVKGRVDSWGLGNEPPQISPRQPADTGQAPLPVERGAFEKWLLDDFAPVFLDATKNLGTSFKDPKTGESFQVTPMVP